MKLVIDANVGIYAIVPEKNSAKALQLREDFRNGIHELLAPDLYFLECGNILTMAARSGRISPADLPAAYMDLMKHQPIIVPSTSLLPSAFIIASQIRVSLYDAIYLALSRQEGCPLVTNDQKLMNAAPGFSFLTLDQI